MFDTSWSPLGSLSEYVRFNHFHSVSLPIMITLVSLSSFLTRITANPVITDLLTSLTFLLSVFNTVGTVILQNLRQRFHSKFCKGSSLHIQSKSLRPYSGLMILLPLFSFISFQLYHWPSCCSSTLLGMSQPRGFWIGCCLCCSAPPRTSPWLNSSLYLQWDLLYLTTVMLLLPINPILLILPYFFSFHSYLSPSDILSIFFIMFIGHCIYFLLQECKIYKTWDLCSETNLYFCHGWVRRFPRICQRYKNLHQ